MLQKQTIAGILAKRVSISSQSLQSFSTMGKIQKEKLNPLQSHHLFAKNDLILGSFELQTKLRKTLHLEDIKSLLQERKEVLFKNNKFSTVVLQFLTENYIDPRDSIIIQNRVSQLYEFLHDYFRNTDQNGLQTFPLYELCLYHSLTFKTIIYFNEKPYHSSWVQRQKEVRTMLERVFPSSNTQPTERNSNKNITMSLMTNLLCSASHQDEKLIEIALDKSQQIIIQEKPEVVRASNFIMYAFKQLSFIDWSKARKYNSIYHILITEIQTIPIDSITKVLQVYEHINALKLHLVGPRTLPPLLRHILHYFIGKMKTVPIKIVLKVLKSFDNFPNSYETQSFKTILAFCKQHIFPKMSGVAYLPSKRLSNKQIAEIVEQDLVYRPDALVQQCSYILNDLNLTNSILGSDKRTNPILSIIARQLYRKLKNRKSILFYQFPVYTQLSMALYKRGVTHYIPKENESNKSDHSDSLNSMVYDLMIEKVQKETQSRGLENHDAPSDEIHFRIVTEILTPFSINGLMDFLTLIKTVEQERKIANHVFTRFMKFTHLFMNKRAKRVLYNKFTFQLINLIGELENFTENRIINNLMKNIIGYGVIRNEYRQSDEDEFSDEDSTFQEDFPQYGIHLAKCEEYLTRIDVEVKQFDFNLHSHIMFALLRSNILNKKQSQGDENFYRRLFSTLQKKLKPEHEIILIEKFILLDEKSITLVHNFFDFLIFRNTSLKNIMRIVSGLNLQELKSSKGTPFVALTKYLINLHEKSKLREQIEIGNKNKNDKDRYFDIKTVCLAMKNMMHFSKTKEYVIFLKEFISVYLENFPLPDSDSQKFDLHYEYNSAFDLLYLFSEIILIDFEIVSKIKVYTVPNKSISEEKTIEEEQEGKFSIKSPEVENQKPISEMLKYQSKKILEVTNALKNSIERFKKYTALSYATKNDENVYHSIRHLVRELQIKCTLTIATPISVESRQNLLDQILLEKDTHFPLKMQTEFPREWEKNPSYKYEVFQRVNNNLIILKLFCCQKIGLEDNKIEIVKMIGLIESSVRNNKLSLIELRDSFSQFPQTVLREILEKKEVDQDQIDSEEQNDNGLSNFQSFLLPVIEQLSLQPSRIMETSFYFIELLEKLLLFSIANYNATNQEKLQFQYIQYQLLNSQQDYPPKMMKTRYSECIKNLIKNTPKMYSAADTIFIIRILMKTRIYDPDIVAYLWRQISYNSFLYKMQINEVYEFMAHIHYRNSFANPQHQTILKKIEKQMIENVKQRLVQWQTTRYEQLKYHKHVGKQDYHDLQITQKQSHGLGRYVNYLWAHILLTYDEKDTQMRLNPTINHMIALSQNSLFMSTLSVFIRDFGTKIKSVHFGKNLRNKLVRFNYLESMYVKVYLFAKLMVYFLPKLAEKYNLKHLNNSLEEVQKMKKLIENCEKHYYQKNSQKIESIIEKFSQKQYSLNKNFDLQRFLRLNNINQAPFHKYTINNSSLPEYYFDYVLTDTNSLIFSTKLNHFDQSSHHANGQLKMDFIIIKSYLLQELLNQDQAASPQVMIFDTRVMNSRVLEEIHNEEQSVEEKLGKILVPFDQFEKGLK